MDTMYGPSQPMDLDTPCTSCQHFGGLLDRGYSAWCVDPKFNHRRTQQILGCAFWRREPGSDDEVLPEVQARLDAGKALI